MKFGPQNKDEASVFALEELRADVQYQILRRMKQLGWSQATLARKMGTSAAWVSQILDDDANLTLESISKVFLVLGIKCHVSALPVEGTYHDALWDRIEIPAWDKLGFVDIGRHEAADYSSVAHRPKRSAGGFVRKTNVNGLVSVSDCLEAA